MDLWYLIMSPSWVQGYNIIACMIPREVPVGNKQNKLLLENMEVKQKGKERNILRTVSSDSAFACNPG